MSWRLGDVAGDLTKTVSVRAALSSQAGFGSMVVNQASFAGVVNSQVGTAMTMVMP